MRLKFPTFIDHHPPYTVGGYPVTNEEPEIFDLMLGTQRFKRAAGIAGGGDVLFTALAPRSDQVYGVDHSYHSIGALYCKIALLQLVTPYELTALLVQNNVKELTTLLNKAWAYTPADIRIGHANHPVGADMYVNLRREWCVAGTQRLQRIPSLLKKTTIVHGDLFDLPAIQNEKFDLFYISNALEHNGRSGAAPTIDQFADLIAPGGLLLFTMGSTAVDKTATKFEKVHKVPPYRTHSGCTWNYYVMRRKEDAPQVSTIIAGS